LPPFLAQSFKNPWNFPDDKIVFVILGKVAHGRSLSSFRIENGQ
jgi:hypothetical protein